MSSEVLLDQGFEYISDTAAHTGAFCRLYALTAAVLNTATVVRGATGNSFAAVAIPAGGFIDGQFSSVTLTSGTIIAYKANRG
tara:strand:- start:3515 stop:3763 length:249 start_codon:yes stop_codon:yes gene_type:complete